MLAHFVGDFLFQTDFQAIHKFGGLGPDPVRRRALATLVATYTVAFGPALRPFGARRGAWLAAEIAIPHLLIDDGRAVRWYMRNVKRVTGTPPPTVGLGVDQTLHFVCLALTSLRATR
jgi:hypothetical protein